MRGRSADPAADSRSLCRSVRQRGKVDPVFVEDEAALLEVLPGLLQPGDLLLLQGAGDIGGISQRWLNL